MQSLVTSTEYQVQMIIDDNPNICGQNLRPQSEKFEEASSNFDAMEADIILLAMPRSCCTTKHYSKNQQICT